MSSTPGPGMFYMVVGPSGVGKGTVLGMLKERHPEFVYPVSVTTRAMRAGEKDDEVYRFISDEEFDRMHTAGELLEWAIVHATCKYATVKSAIVDPLLEGKTVVREIDIQGLRSVKAALPREQYHSIFLAPPDRDTLIRHIRGRQPDMTDEELGRRMTSADKELAGKDEADTILVIQEGDKEATYRSLEAAILAPNTTK